MDVGNADSPPRDSPQGGIPHADGGAESYRRFREDGDVTGLAEIIRDYKDGLILYLTTIVGNVDEAEDLGGGHIRPARHETAARPGRRLV